MSRPALHNHRVAARSYALSRLGLALLMAVGLLAACAAGVTPQQRQTDAELDYGRKEQSALVDQRMEFDQLAEDFLLTHNPVFLGKMAVLLERATKGLDKARLFRDLLPPYHRGIALARRQAAERAARTGEKGLCEMLLVFGELHLLHGDPATARETLTKVLTGFPGAPFADYRAKASALLEMSPRQQAAVRGAGAAAPTGC